MSSAEPEDTLEKELAQIEATVAEARDKCAQFHRLQQEEAIAAAASARKGLQFVRKALGTRGAEDSINNNDAGAAGNEKGAATADPAAATAAAVDAMLQRCDVGTAQLRAVRAIRPLTGSLFLRFFLGRVNVRVFNDAERKTLRHEYHKFKDRTTIIYILFPLSMLLVQYFKDYLRDSQWSMRFQHLWMLYYYVSLALRENILRMNGSKIMSWWIIHHHLASVASLVFLTWPHGPAYLQFKQHYLLFCVLQGCVQLVQNTYQKQRHYTLMSLGKAKAMDISSTETIVEPPPSGSRGFLALVLVFVFISQALQVYTGWLLVEHVFTELNLWQTPNEYREEMQSLTTGMIGIVLGVGNFVATMSTLWKKKKKADEQQEKKKGE